MCRAHASRHIYGKLKVYPYIYDSDCETWPEELADWWCRLLSKNAVANVVRCLREYYYEDESACCSGLVGTTGEAH